MSDNLMTPLAWQTFCNRVAQKLGDEVAPEDVIDIVRELDPDLVYEPAVVQVGGGRIRRLERRRNDGTAGTARAGRWVQSGITG